MRPTTYKLRDGQQLTITPLGGNRVDMHLRNANGESTATVKATRSEAEALAQEGTK
ncbi:hypothetical protein [Streptomyces lycii]|uniref:Uncharacterized protein n=1 Tax=Streptomyces lycii TaxID=2654337 RepID=A0ABQ7FMZ7_9ACTN|nr:hypothetical protein [Streptomyces lycii]KAF4408623.1 hypothetical protein GCU69_13065 [Streptomyces lycii]